MQHLNAHSMKLEMFRMLSITAAVSVATSLAVASVIVAVAALLQ